ncbi:MAG: hypothetical protein ABI718_15885 [Acidobacteriota bacterium]
MADLHVERKKSRFLWLVALVMLASGAAVAWYLSGPASRSKLIAVKAAPAAAPKAASSVIPSAPPEPLLTEPMPSLPSATTTEVTTTSGVRATREEKDATMPADGSDEDSTTAEPAVDSAVTSPSTAPAAASEGFISDLAVITDAADRTAFDGRTVRLTGLKLQRQVGGLLAIGTDPQHWILVAPAIGRGPKIPSGASLSVNGMIQILPAQGESAKRWKISSASQQHLAGKQVYIQASLIDVSR